MGMKVKLYPKFRRTYRGANIPSLQEETKRKERGGGGFTNYPFSNIGFLYNSLPNSFKNFGEKVTFIKELKI